MKIRYLIPALLITSSVLTSCGGSSSSSNEDTASANTEAAGAETQLGGDSSSQFCTYAGMATGAFNAAFADENPISDEEFWKESLTVASQMVEGAPDEIKADAGKVQAGIVAYTTFLANYGYDAEKMAADSQTSAAVKALDTDGSLTQANDSVNAYIDKNC